MIIDNIKFAKARQQLQQTINMANLTRLQEIEPYLGEISFSLEGLIDNLHRPALKLKIYGIISTLCHNCLQSLDLNLDCQLIIPIFATDKMLEQALMEEGADAIEYGVVADEEFDVIKVVEDEVITSLPYAPKHEECIGFCYHDDTVSPFNTLKE